ncbi:DUF1156 domain-containing protein [Deinococcus arenicola]|uniref:DUF1156 domain-containing protein n=1 Tax=Deinococcus arenicola TaxID=2994950 RepID=A0ABU4DML7_9DEIO|nr:DUF1156 domain-containing protein [Deinococcus sp. ZS9-10]MDV6373668.1 DUF1156 domain-containing protein [Deinococcus sp. ZS9-10]
MTAASAPRRKLIEVALPLEAINAASAREKSIRHGHPSTLHLWWARRPLATARAILFAQLVDDPNHEAAPPEFVEACQNLVVLTGRQEVKDKSGKITTKARIPGVKGTFATAEDTPRNRLFDFIAELVEWENTTNETVMKQAHALILLSTDGNPPPVLDPFSGGCTIPLEAQRLGLEAHGSDLNPVAVMIGKASIEIPPRFAGRPPVHPQKKAISGGTYKGAQGLAEDVRYYGQWMKEQAEARIGHLYPKAKLPGGGEATVIAWLWARTVKCPNPVCGANMPLASSFELSTKAGKRAWVEPQVDRSVSPPKVSFQIGGPTGTPPESPKTGRGANFRCVACGTAVDDKHIKGEGKAGRMGAQLMATVAEGERKRIYLAPTEEMEQAARVPEPAWKPDQPMPENPRWFSPPDYGMPLFSDIFTNRQLTALTTFSDLVAEAREHVKADALAAGMEEGQFLRDGGNGAQAYAEAVGVYLAFTVDKVTASNNTLARWRSGEDKSAPAFSRQALPMVWDSAEVNPFAGAGGDFLGAIQGTASVLEKFGLRPKPGSELQIDAATRLIPQNALISSDPPYYDNIGYADLSDFFYVWMRRTLRSTYPDLFGGLLVPKAAELVATPYRHGGKDNAEAFFMDGMTKAITNMAAQGKQDYPAAIYYAFKQSETAEAGISSTGWATFLEAIIEAGYSIGGTWPMRTEGSGRMNAQSANSLASSIVMVCRPRPANAPMTTRADFLRELRRSLPDALQALTASNIAPVDMAQASIGPGMAVFSKYAQVLESDGSRMPVRVALQLINAALDEFFSEQEGHLDEDTRFAVTWFESHGTEEAAYGDAETLATARGVSVAGVQDAGLIVARAGKVRLRTRDELSQDWSPQTDKRPTAWEAVQHLARINAKDGADAAGVLMAQLGELADSARQLAYRLYGICERKGWSAEGQVYNALVASWTEAAEAAARVDKQPTNTQPGLFD